MHRVLFALAAAGGVCFVLLPTLQAQTVWSGFDFSFTKVDGAEETDSDNWDIITSNVAIIRSDSGGIYNPFEEGSYSSASPADTEWATNYNNPDDAIAATNHAALDFVPWRDAYVEGPFTGELPDSLLSRNAVVHLITDDIYLDLRFTAWTPSAAGGGFSYERGLPPDEPETTGDYNLDGFVNAADYVYWRKTEGDDFPEGTGADGDGDGTIDDDDYDFWAEQFGTDVSPGSGNAALPVPEPAGLTLYMLTLLFAGMHSRSRK